MTTAFPAALDSFTNPAPGLTGDSLATGHAAQHANANDAIEAIEALLGITGSTDPASIQARIAAINAGPTDMSASKRCPLMLKSVCGRFIKNTSASNRTTSLQFSLATHYDRVRIILPNLHTSAIDNVKVCVAPTNTDGGDTQTTAMVYPSGGESTWVNATFSGSASGSLALSDGVTPSFTATDWIDVSSIPRTDGGEFPILLVRIEQPAAAGYMTNPFSDMSGMSNKATVGQRPYRSAAIALLGVTTKSSVNAAAYSANHQAAIVQYAPRVLGRCVMGFGDSLTEGAGGVSPPTWSWLHKACEAVHSSSTPIEIANLGWGGKDSDEFFTMASLFLPMVPDAIAFYAAFTPNSSLVAANVDVFRRYTARFLELCNTYKITPILNTGIPSTYGLSQGKNWGSADALRISRNSEILQAGVVAADFSSVMTGEYNATNTTQRDILSGMSDDGLHPNNAGANAMTPVATAALLLASAR